MASKKGLLAMLMRCSQCQYANHVETDTTKSRIICGRCATHTMLLARHQSRREFGRPERWRRLVEFAYFIREIDRVGSLTLELDVERAT